MGLFGSRTQTQVGTQFQRVLEDAALPNGVRTGAVKSIFGDGEQLTEHILEELCSGIGLKAGRMAEYGRNAYTYGLPQSALHSSFAGKDATRAAIMATEGPVQLSYYHFGPLNNLHYGWSVLVSQYGYHSGANELATLSAAKGSTVYLTDMVAVVKDATQAEIDSGVLDVWGVAPDAGYSPLRANMAVPGLSLLASGTPYEVDPAVAGDYLRVEYCWQEQVPAVVEGVALTQTVVRTESLQIPFPGPGLDLEASYHQARYTRGDGNAGYFTYAAGSGSQPAIDAVFEQAYDAGGEFMPWAYFRFDKTSMGADKTAAAYLTSKKLLDYVGMDYAALVDSIDQNPDIGDVEQAMLVMAVPAKTSDPIEQQYLFDFFAGVYADSQAVASLNNRFSSLAEENMVARFDTIPQGSIVIQDRRFKMALAYSSIIRRTVSGIVGAVGAHASGVDTSGKLHWYRRQLTDTLCDEIAITGLSMTYWVWGDYTTVGDENNEAILMIPLDNSIAKEYPLPQREVLYARSLHYVFNSRVVTTLKWYQTGLFKVVLLVIAVALAWQSYGASLKAFAAAVAAGTLTMEMVMAAVVVVLKYVAEMVAIRLFVKEAGAKLAFIAAIVAAVAGMYGQLAAESAASAPAWAKDMLALSTNLSSAAQHQLKSDFGDLLADAQAFQSEVDQKEQLLQNAEQLLNNGIKLDPLIIFGESPTDFYQRTVHSGNIGALSMDVVASYVDVSLMLPKPHQTLGDSYA